LVQQEAANCEAEYVVLSAAVQEAVRKLLKDFGA